MYKIQGETVAALIVTKWKDHKIGNPQQAYICVSRVTNGDNFSSMERFTEAHEQYFRPPQHAHEEDSRLLLLSEYLFRTKEVSDLFPAGFDLSRKTKAFDDEINELLRIQNDKIPLKRAVKRRINVFEAEIKTDQKTEMNPFKRLYPVIDHTSKLPIPHQTCIRADTPIPSGLSAFTQITDNETQTSSTPNIKFEGFKWANNSCAFDTVMTILLYYCTSLNDDQLSLIKIRIPIFDNLFGRFDYHSIKTKSQLQEIKSNWLRYFENFFELGRFHETSEVFQRLFDSISDSLITTKKLTFNIHRECGRIVLNANGSQEQEENINSIEVKLTPECHSIQESILMDRIVDYPVEICTCLSSRSVPRSIYTWPELLYIRLNFDITNNLFEEIYVDQFLEISSDISYDLFSVEYFANNNHFIATIQINMDWYDYDGISPQFKRRTTPLCFIQTHSKIVCGLYYKKCNRSNLSSSQISLVESQTINFAPSVLQTENNIALSPNQLQGFKWARNSCAFDTTMTILLMFYWFSSSTIREYIQSSFPFMENIFGSEINFQLLPEIKEKWKQFYFNNQDIEYNFVENVYSSTAKVFSYFFKGLDSRLVTSHRTYFPIHTPCGKHLTDSFAGVEYPHDYHNKNVHEFYSSELYDNLISSAIAKRVIFNIEMCSCSGSNKVRNSRFRKFIYQQWPILLYIIILYRENEQFCLGCSLETKMTFQNGIVYDLISVEYYDGSHLTAALKYEHNWYDYDGMKIHNVYLH